VIRDLKAFFPKTKRIADITPADALDFKAHLVERKLAAATIAKRIEHTRMFFGDALQREIVSRNVFAGVKTSAPVDLSVRKFVDRETTARILAACDPVWQTIIALARFGGLRTPSETLSLRWSDIDFAAQTMTVTSCKTAHCGKEKRTVPLFPELRVILDEAWELAPAGAEYVVDVRYRGEAFRNGEWKAVNLRTQFQRILDRAGIEHWPKLFHALRSSRETELAAEHPVHVAAAWLGNSPAIAAKHYLLIRPSDHDKAVQNPVQSMHAKARTVPLPKQGTPIFAEDCNPSRLYASNRVEDRGVEPLTSCMPSNSELKVFQRFSRGFLHFSTCHAVRKVSRGFSQFREVSRYSRFAKRYSMAPLRIYSAAMLDITTGLPRHRGAFL
jgi:integrase